MSEVKLVAPGTFDRLELEARIIAGTHFVVERLTGGAWAELGDKYGTGATTTHMPSMWLKHFPERPQPTPELPIIGINIVLGEEQYT